MNQTNAYTGLNFRARTRRIDPHVLTVGGGFSIFALMWWIVPSNALFWLFSPILLVLLWMANYGWRPAVARVIKFLQFLEER